MVDEKKQDNEQSTLMTSGIVCLKKLRSKHVVNSINRFASILIGMNNWHSVRCQLTWKFRETQPLYYIQLQAAKTIVAGFSRSLLPTPSASDVIMGSVRKLTVKDGEIMNLSPKGVKYGISIRQLAEQGFLPTPLASDATVGAVVGKNDVFKITKGLPRKVNKNGKDGGVGLARLVSLLTLPLDKKCTLTSSKAVKLNAGFVLEMMGFSEDWTLRPFQNQSVP